MSTDKLPLLAWKPQCTVIVFPTVNRIGKIRDTAMKLLEKPTEASVRYYRKQVSASLNVQLEKIGVSEAERSVHLAKFWQAVEREAAALEALSFRA